MTNDNNDNNDNINANASITLPCCSELVVVVVVVVVVLWTVIDSLLSLTAITRTRCPGLFWLTHPLHPNPYIQRTTIPYACEVLLSGEC